MNKTSANREDLRIAISFLRAFRGWNQTEMAEAAGMDKSQLSLYELGRKSPSRRTIDRLVRAVGLPYSLFQDVLGMVRMVRIAAKDLNVAGSQVAEDVACAVAASVKLALSQSLMEMAREEEDGPVPVSPQEDRAEAEALWDLLSSYSPQDRRLLVGEGREYQSWAMVERICHECGRVAAQAPAEALEMAELALTAAARTPGESGWRSRLQGYAWAFLGDARRAAGDQAGAEEAFLRARDLWDAGAPEDFPLLDEERFRQLQPN